MDREQLIKCIAEAVEQGPGRTLPPYRKMAEHVLDALTAAGMVVVPRAELEWVQQRCNEASPSYSERDILHDIHAKVRAMTEAANAE